MRPIIELKKLNLISWPVLLCGFRKGWVTKSDIADYATQHLANYPDQDDHSIILLASANFWDNAEVNELLLQAINNPAWHQEALNKWKLAKLLALSNSKLSNQEKIDKLQEVYAELDYPKEMVSCSIYSQDAIDPLVAMDQVISLLKKEVVNPQPH